MPTPYPPEFRRDVIAVAREGDQSREQVAQEDGPSVVGFGWGLVTDHRSGGDSEVE